MGAETLWVSSKLSDTTFVIVGAWVGLPVRFKNGTMPRQELRLTLFHCRSRDPPLQFSAQQLSSLYLGLRQ